MRGTLGRVNRRLLLATTLIFLILLFAPIFFWAVEHSRSDDVHSVGDAYGWLFRTLFDPEQQTLLFDAIVQPEGRIHFAGEHASLAHAWIQGAIESGLRAAAEIHERAGAAQLSR